MLKKKDEYKVYTIIKKKNYTIIVVNCEKYIFLKKYKNLNTLLKGNTLKHWRLYYLGSKIVAYSYYLRSNEKFN